MNAATPRGGDRQRRRAVPLPALSRPLAGLPDQRLQIRDTLFEIAILFDLRPAGGAVTVTMTSSDDAIVTSTMRHVKLDRDDALDLHEQVAAEIRRAIADGEAKPGERLPPAKDLAAVLGVNTNTVLRALRELRDEGILEFRRGRGITITGTPERSAVIEQAKELLHYARTHGYKPDELIQIIQQLG